MIDPVELRRLREQAEARKLAALRRASRRSRRDARAGAAKLRAWPPPSASTSTRSRCCAIRAAAPSPTSCRPRSACLDAGAHGITVHPRPDARHIRAEDVLRAGGADAVARRGIQSRGQSVRAAARGLSGVRCAVRADAAGAGDAGAGFGDGADHVRPWLRLRRGDLGALRDRIAELRALGCRVSLFVDAGCPDIERAADVGAQRIELYTGPYRRSVRARRCGARRLRCARRPRGARRRSGWASTPGTT